MNTVVQQVLEAQSFSFLADLSETVKSLYDLRFHFLCKAQNDFLQWRKLFQRNALILVGSIYEIVRLENLALYDTNNMALPEQLAGVRAL